VRALPFFPFAEPLLLLALPALPVSDGADADPRATASEASRRTPLRFLGAAPSGVPAPASARASRLAAEASLSTARQAALALPGAGSRPAPSSRRGARPGRRSSSLAPTVAAPRRATRPHPAFFPFS